MVRPSRAEIVGATGKEEVRIPKDATKDFKHNKCRYLIEEDAVKLRKARFLSLLDFVFVGSMLLLIGLGFPPFIIAGIAMLIIGFVIKGAESFFLVPYLLYFKGQPKPVRFMSGPELKVPQLTRDRKGNVTGIKYFDGYDLDAIIEPHVVRDLGYKPLQNIPWKLIILGGIAAVVVLVIISMASG